MTSENAYMKVRAGGVGKVSRASGRVTPDYGAIFGGTGRANAARGRIGRFEVDDMREATDGVVDRAWSLWVAVGTRGRDLHFGEACEVAGLPPDQLSLSAWIGLTEIGALVRGEAWGFWRCIV